jgi:hypothetical protein
MFMFSHTAGKHFKYDILKCESVHLYLETLQMLRNECLHSKSVNSDMKYYIVHNIAQNLFMREINIFSVVLQLLVCVIAKKKARTVSVNCNIFFLKFRKYVPLVSLTSELCTLMS